MIDHLRLLFTINEALNPRVTAIWWGIAFASAIWLPMIAVLCAAAYAL